MSENYKPVWVIFLLWNDNGKDVNALQDAVFTSEQLAQETAKRWYGPNRWKLVKLNLVE